MFETFRIASLPGYARVFVGIFTTLMLAVCFWAMFLLYLEEFESDADLMTAVEKEQLNDSPPEEYEEDLQRQEDAETIAEDSAAVLAPIWDSAFAGRDVRADSTTNVELFRDRDREMELAGEIEADELSEDAPDLKHNVELAHTHVNGQTLLYFAMGLVFLFTSVRPKIKKIVLCVFGIAVLLHAVGLTGHEYHWFFNDILAISGALILAGIAYMAVIIYSDLAGKGTPADAD